ncbi:MAG: TetR/AcrR family transcriptional regulator [bacterium]|nr:TetR/AcrR family transcriptional regulator [bacterium]
MSRSEDQTRVRPPKQERSRRSLQRIIDTAREFLSRRTPGEVSLRDIASAADVSVSSLFARFPSKDALLDHLHSELCRERLEEVEQIVASLERDEGSLEQVAFDGICTMLDRAQTRGGLEHAFQIVASQQEHIRQREESFQRQRLGFLTAFVARRLGQQGNEGQIEPLLQMVIAGGRELAGEARAEDARSEEEREALARKLTTLLLRAVGAVEQEQVVADPDPTLPEQTSRKPWASGQDHREARARILSAGLTVFDGRPLTDIREEEIASLAGITPEELRGHFENKVALLHALLDDFSREVVQTVDELADRTEWGQRNMRDLTRDVVTLYMTYWQRERGVIETIRSAELSDEALFQRHFQLKRDIEKRILAVVKLIGPTLTIHPGDEGRFRRTIQALAAATRLAVDRPYVYDIGEDGIGKEEWLDEFVELAIRAFDFQDVTPGRQSQES